MTRRKPTTKFRLDDRVRITGPTVANDTGRTHTLAPDAVGTVADMWEAFGEYIVAVDNGCGGYDQRVFPESSLDAEGGPR